MSNDLGRRMRVERERAGLSQADVADALGCTQANVCHIESGRSRVSTDQLEAFARLLKIEAGSLLAKRRKAG
jgi:transcriptional regulator with XRE-family HTH domain